MIVLVPSTCKLPPIRTLPVVVTVATEKSALVATDCPIATSFALTVTPVPAPTVKVLFAAIVPPPVSPAPAVSVTPV